MPTQLHKMVDSMHKHLEHLESDSLDKIDFNWNGNHYFATKVEKGGKSVLEVETNLGRLYYTVENSANRGLALNEIFEQKKARNSGVKLLRNNIVTFQASTSFDQDISNGDFFTILSITLLDIQKQTQELSSYLKAS